MEVAEEGTFGTSIYMQRTRGEMEEFGFERSCSMRDRGTSEGWEEESQ